MTEEKENEVSKESRDEQQSGREEHREEQSDWDRQSDRRYLDEFEKIFSEGDERDGSLEHNSAKKGSSTEGDSWQSEYESYEEW